MPRAKKIEKMHALIIEATFANEAQEKFFGDSLRVALKAIAGFSNAKHKQNSITIVMDNEVLVDPYVPPMPQEGPVGN